MKISRKKKQQQNNVQVEGEAEKKCSDKKFFFYISMSVYYAIKKSRFIVFEIKTKLNIHTTTREKKIERNIILSLYF